MKNQFISYHQGVQSILLLMSELDELVNANLKKKMDANDATTFEVLRLSETFSYSMLTLRLLYLIPSLHV